MAKTDSTMTAAAPAGAPVEQPPPALGTLVLVRVAQGCVLVNNETGAYFAPDVATPVTVTTTLLRRLADGDLVVAG